MKELLDSDIYFNRSAAVVADTPRADMPVRYSVFARQGGVLCGIDDAVDFMTKHANPPMKIEANFDGDAYKPLEAVMVIEGPFGSLVNLETTSLGMLSLSGAASHMSRLVHTAGDSPVVDMSARH